MSDPQQLLDAAHALQRSGNVGTAGNLSLRQADGFLITPSGVRYDQLTVDQLVSLQHSGAPLGPGKPSSEWRFHRDIYQARPEAQAIVHSHAPHATALACLGLGIPAFHYEIAFAGGSDIRCARYATFGTQALSDSVLAALEGRRACLMANHGFVCFGDSMTSALALAELVEQLARIYLLARKVGEPLQIDEAEMTRVQTLFADYGPRASEA